MINNIYEYTKIHDNIWQIEEDNGVCCTLIKGSEMAVLIDTGYGERNLRAFVEENISTPYIVINSHGHPDHIGGNHWFDEVYSLKDEWDVIKHFEENEPKGYELKEIQIGQKFSLWNSESEDTDEWYEFFDIFASLLNHPKSLVRNRVLQHI